MKKISVLITCGATWTPIDDVRVISNISSGEMGHLIAQAFERKGASVTILEGPVTHVMENSKIKIIKYRFFDELEKELKKELKKKYEIIIHAAAVSDFKVKQASKIKLSSEKSLTIKLEPTTKLIQEIKRISPTSFLVGFKLESHLNEKNIYNSVKALFTHSACDLVIANTLNNAYKGYIIDADGNILSKAKSKNQIAQNLLNYIL